MSASTCKTVKTTELIGQRVMAFKRERTRTTRKQPENNQRTTKCETPKAVAVSMSPPFKQQSLSVVPVQCGRSSSNPLNSPMISTPNCTCWPIDLGRFSHGGLRSFALSIASNAVPCATWPSRTSSVPVLLGSTPAPFEWCFGGSTKYAHSPERAPLSTARGGSGARQCLEWRTKTNRRRFFLLFPF